MSYFQDFLQNLDLSALGSLVVQAIAALICIIFHECAHGFAADRLGDHTARNRGRLSWNPIRHIDPFGLLMMVVAGVGWAKPVPVNPNNFKHPKRGMDRSCGACGQFSAGDHLPADWKWSDHSGPAYCRRYGCRIGVPVLLSPYPPYVGAQCWTGSL